MKGGLNLMKEVRICRNEVGRNGVGLSSGRNRAERECLSRRQGFGKGSDKVGVQQYPWLGVGQQSDRGPLPSVNEWLQSRRGRGDPRRPIKMRRTGALLM